MWTKAQSAVRENPLFDYVFKITIGRHEYRHMESLAALLNEQVYVYVQGYVDVTTKDLTGEDRFCGLGGVAIGQMRDLSGRFAVHGGRLTRVGVCVGSYDCYNLSHEISNWGVPATQYFGYSIRVDGSHGFAVDVWQVNKSL